ncbi:MAG: glycosyltransferase [Acidimicrobiales bacterium]
MLIVDWLGRGGIAHCTGAWEIELRARDMSVTTVTRSGREMLGPAVHTADGPGRIRAHMAVARLAQELIAEERPDTVVIQNWVIPVIERMVHEAARRIGAKVVMVVHDHRLHSPVAGIRAGLRDLLQKADTVVTHSRFVQEAVQGYAGRTSTVVPLPVQVAMVSKPRPAQPILTEEGLLGVHFGILKRSYKGTGVVVDLAADPPTGWTFAVVGTGAPPVRPGLASIDRFLEAGELCSLVAQSAASLLPYRFATQSGAVVLAQACGSIPVATAVGGIPEQIEDGETGRLLPAGSGVAEWRRVLEELADDSVREKLIEGSQRAVWAQHRRFVDAVVEVAS